MTSLLVSVVLPVHNGEQYLGEALESVFAQDYRPLEVVVVDDGSTDGSQWVAAGFPALLHSQLPRGVAAARNTGVGLSSGNLIAFLDQDDIWVREKVRLQVGFLLSHPDALHVIGRQRLFLEGGTSRPPWLRPEHLEEPQVGYLPSAWMGWRNAFSRVGPFDEGYVTSSDADWFFRASARGCPPSLMDDVLVHRRIHRTNQTHGATMVRSELLEIARTAVSERHRGEGPWPSDDSSPERVLKERTKGTERA